MKFLSHYQRWCRPVLFSVLIGLMVFAITRRHTPEYGFTRMINMGSQVMERALPEVQSTAIEVRSLAGYDGSQYVQLSFDPLLLKERETWSNALDVPSYRAKRILLPWMSYLLGAGHPEWMVQIYSLLNPLFWLALLFMMARLCPGSDLRSLAIIAGVLLSTGALESTRRALTDLPSLTLMIASVLFVQKNRTGGAIAAMTAACLSRETTLLSLPALWRGRESIWRNATVLVLPVLLCAVWFLYVKFRFPAVTHTLSHNLGWPFVTMIERIQMAGAAGIRQPLQLFCILAMISFAVQAAYFLRHPQWKNPWWRMGIFFTPLYFCLAMPVWEEYYAVTRAVLPMTAAFHLLLLERKGWTFWAWWTPSNLYLWQGFNKWFFTAN